MPDMREWINAAYQTGWMLVCNKHRWTAFS